MYPSEASGARRDRGILLAEGPESRLPRRHPDQVNLERGDSGLPIPCRTARPAVQRAANAAPV